MANTLHEHYQGQGKPLPSIKDRGELYQQYGLGNSAGYVGTASQNTALLNAIRGGQPTPETQPVASSVPVQVTGTVSHNMSEDSMVEAYVQHGWDANSARADIRAGGWQNKEWLRQGGMGGLPGQPQVPNLQEVYDSLFNTDEIKAKKAEIAKAEEERDRAISETQNNPWFSQATRGGKIAGINSDAERRLTRINNELTRMTTDAQVQYNVKMNQYTLDREAYNSRLELFTSLLNAGAFTNASYQDKSQWSLSTGIPVSMMDSIITKQKNDNLKLENYDDGINQYVIALDSKGEVVNRTIIGKSKPTRMSGGSGNDISSVFEMLFNQNRPKSVWVKNTGGSTYESYEQIKSGSGLDFNSIWNSVISSPVARNSRA